MRHACLVLCVVLLACDGPDNRHAGEGPPDAGPLFDDAGQRLRGPVAVTMTADNAYSFGYGTESSLDVFFQGRLATIRGQIFDCPVGEGPETYTVPAEAAPYDAYLYIVAWDDLILSQGVLGQFERAHGKLYTGDLGWEVCATGIDHSQDIDGPSQIAINQQIVVCNAGTGDPATTSKGWVNRVGPVTPGAVGRLAVGEDNSDPDDVFPIVCQPDRRTGAAGIDAAARWMWYSPSPFLEAFRSSGTNELRAYLIFRLPADRIVVD
jgi:hypothetical protein